MIVYITHTDGKDEPKPWFLRGSPKKIQTHLNATKSHSVNGSDVVTVYGTQIHSMTFPDNMRWDAFSRKLIHQNGKQYDVRIEHDRQIINEWVKEGEEKKLNEHTS